MTNDQIFRDKKRISDREVDDILEKISQSGFESLTKVEKNKLMLRFRIFDDGIGFRYEVPRQNQLSEFTILDELTEFNLSEDSPSWWIPAYAYRRYEFLYAKTLISEISRDKFSELVENLNGPRIGPEAVQTPFTTQRKDGTVVTIHEANLV